MQLIIADPEKCMGCRTCELTCAVQRSSVSKNLVDATFETPRPRPRVQVRGEEDWQIALHCRHCTVAPCLEICSTGALKRDRETGLIFQQEDKCIGCWMCVMVCPFGLIRPDPVRGRAWKCDGCYRMEEPYCVAACPTGALTVVEVEKDSDIVKEKVLAWGRLATKIGKLWEGKEN